VARADDGPCQQPQHDFETLMPQFEDWNSFTKFHQEVTRHRRYVRTPEAERFLRDVAVTCKARLVPIEQGRPLWRAQLGNAWRLAEPDKPKGFEVAVPHPASRMKPLANSAIEGRVNPKGIPCLYLAMTKTAAMSEVRPWLGAMVSVALFETTSALTVVDCSLLHDQFLKLAFLDRIVGEDVPPEKIDDIVWASIDRAFAEPVTRADDTADYAATQVIAELFRAEGYDGVAYKSAFGADGYNVALFRLDAANQVDAELHETTDINFKFEDRSP
jgi:hypothetical protein